MRIALCSYELAGVRGGGIGTYVAEAAKALTAAGHEVWLVTEAPDGAAQERLRAHRDFHRVVFVQDTGDAAGMPPFAFGGAALRFAALAERSLVQAGQPFDYIEFADFGGWGACVVEQQRRTRAFGDAVVAVVLHSPTHECSEYNLTLRLMVAAERDLVAIEDATIRRAPVVWSPSQRLREMVAQRLGLPGDFAQIIRYPMELPGLTAALPRPGRRLDELRFLYFGRIEPRKGVRQLVDAFAAMPGLSIDCIGGDGETSPLQTSEVAYLQARGAGNVRFLGRLPREQMLQRLQQADVVILPSPWENWPNTCIEAMAAGRVVIGGKNGGMGEMIEHGVSGFVVDGGDAADLVRVVQDDLAAALPRLDEIGRNAAARIRELCEPRRYVDAIAGLVAARQAPPPAAAAAPRVSVVVVAERDRPGGWQAVRASLASVLEQDYRDLEVVLAHDPRDAEQVASAGADPRVRALAIPGGPAAARNGAVAACSGALVLCLGADTRLAPAHVGAVVQAFGSAPGAMAVQTGFDAVTPDGEPIARVTPLCFDRPVQLLRHAREDAGVWFRREVFARHGVRFEPEIVRYPEWSFWLCMARRGLPIERVTEALGARTFARVEAFDAERWASHLGEVGLLVERELSRADDDDERDALRDLLQSGGIGAHVAAIRGVELPPERPARIAQRARPGVTRYVFAERLAGLLEKAPPLHRLARGLMRRLMRSHRRRDERAMRG
jgi:glycosyltransferase involved in cell wall biosynthesis